MGVNASSNDELKEIFKKFREGSIREEDLTEEQYVYISRMYDKEIRELKASNRSRATAINAWVDSKNTDNETVKQVRSMLSDTPATHSGKTLDKYYLKENSTGLGLDLYEGLQYLGTYQSYDDYIFDMMFHWSIVDFDTMINMFSRKDISILPPSKYRAVVSELFCITDKIHNYIFYGDTLTSILEKVEKIEKRSVKFPDKFIFGVQGIGIHLFNKHDLKYRFWIGGSNIKSVADVIRIAHDENKLVPNELLQELAELNRVDVFISHKSQDFLQAKKIYDYLVTCGVSVFLSEMSLPAISNADYSAEIDKALDAAKNIIVVATNKENVLSGWVQYEWTAFANEKRSGRKDGNIITLIDENMPLAELPILLRQFEVIPFSNFENVSKYLKLS